MSRAGRVLITAVLILASSASLHAQTWDAIHREMREALGVLSREYFSGIPSRAGIGSAPRIDPELIPSPWLIVVGFTGGLERKDSKASGIVAMNNHLSGELAERGEVRTLTYNNLHWRRARAEVLNAVRAAQERAAGLDGYRQPLIVLHGHSWGAGSVTNLARALRKEDIEVSLAIYIDAFQLRNPRIPDNVRYAVNFYQRAGFLCGLPMRGKRKLIPDDAARTVLLGSYEVDPETEHWGWSWNLLQPLFYRQHHRISHDVRLRRYLLDIVQLQLEMLQRTYSVRSDPSAGMFDRVVILGASVSAAEKAPSPGWILARHLGTPEEKITVFAEGGAASDHHLGYLDNIARIKPTLIVALDLFYHDFKISLFLTQSTKDYLRNYIARLHDTGAVVVVGNIPSLVLLRYEHVNRYLETLLPEFPNLVLIDARTWFDRLNDEGLEVSVNGRTVSLRRNDVFADREHVNPLGSALVANILLEQLKARFPGKVPVEAVPVDLSSFFEP